MPKVCKNSTGWHKVGGYVRNLSHSPRSDKVSPPLMRRRPDEHPRQRRITRLVYLAVVRNDSKIHIHERNFKLRPMGSGSSTGRGPSHGSETSHRLGSLHGTRKHMEDPHVEQRLIALLLFPQNAQPILIGKRYVLRGMVIVQSVSAANK